MAKKARTPSQGDPGPIAATKAGFSSRRRELVVLLAILVVGAFLRFLYLRDLEKDPLFTHPALDAELHDYWAWGLASGDWSVPAGRNDPSITRTPYFRPPGYPYFLSMVYRLAGRSPAAPRLFQFALGLASVALAFALARKRFGLVVAAILAGFMSVYWSFIYFEGELLDPVLLVFLGLALILALSRLIERSGFVPGATAGALLGLFALTRPNALLFLPVAVAWVAWIAKRRVERKRFAATVAGLLVGAILAIAPATIRNYLVSGEWVPISANGGVNLFIGNNPEADGVNAAIPHVQDLTGKGGWTCFDYPLVVQGLARRLGRPVTFAEASRYWTGEAMSYIGTHPGRFIALTAKRAALFWGPSEVGDRDVQLTRESSGVLRNIPVTFPAVLSLSLVGAFLLAKDLKAGRRALQRSTPEIDGRIELAILVGAFVLVYFASFLPFFFNARYRVPVLPFVFLFGSYGLSRIARFVAGRDLRQALIYAGACAVLFPIASLNLAGYQSSRDEWHYQLGNSYRSQGNLDQAVIEYMASIEINPRHPEARNDLAVILMRQGKMEEAIRQFRTAIELDPRDSNAHFNLGGTLMRQARTDDAIEEYRKGLAINPGEVHGLIALGSALLERGDAKAALGQYREALRIRPGEPMAHLGLGRGLLALGQLDEAIKALEEALRLQPSDPFAHYFLGVAVARRGRLQAAMGHYRESLRLRPGFAPAQQALDAALARGRSK